MAKKERRAATESFTAEEGRVKEKKRLTRKHKIIIAVAVIVLAAIIALSVALPLTLGRDGTPEPYFLPFDQKSDYKITAEWKEVRKADNYSVEYCYGERTEENILKAVTSNNFLAVQRQKGVLSLRVKANLPDAVFSEWIAVDVSALKLNAPSVTVDNRGNVSWTAVKYDYYGEKSEISWYYLDIGLNGEYTSAELPIRGNEAALGSFIKQYISNILVTGAEWTDVVFSVRVKATTEPYLSAVPTEKEKYLLNAYEHSDYGYAELIVTQEIYEGL